MTCVVADNSLGPEGGKALASALPHLVQLTSLDLGGTYCVDVDVCIVCLVDLHCSVMTGV